MRKLVSSLSLLCLSLGCAASAAAATIDASQLPTGQTIVNLGFATATSNPRPFAQKSLDGTLGVGVQNGFVDGEIDLDSESIRINFANPMVLSQITLGFLFPAGQYGDVVSEVASIKYSDTPWAAGYLSAIDATTATWSGSGTVTNVSQGVEPHAGVWRIDNPFGNTAVSFVEFTAVYASFPGGGQAPVSSANSDFALVSLSTATPEPSTWGMLGLGLSAIAAASRKLRTRS